MASGIGGGSADAAATVRLISKVYDEPKPPINKLISLGADVPVCMHKGIVRMMGVGEKIINLSPAPNVGILLVNPRKALSTSEVFNAVKRKTTLELSRILSWKTSSIYGLIGLTQCEMISRLLR